FYTYVSRGLSGVKDMVSQQTKVWNEHASTLCESYPQIPVSSAEDPIQQIQNLQVLLKASNEIWETSQHCQQPLPKTIREDTLKFNVNRPRATQDGKDYERNELDVFDGIWTPGFDAIYTFVEESVRQGRNQIYVLGHTDVTDVPGVPEYNYLLSYR